MFLVQEAEAIWEESERGNKMDQVRTEYKHQGRRHWVPNENVTSEPTCISLCLDTIDLHSDLEDGSLGVRHRGSADKSVGRNVVLLSSLLLLCVLLSPTNLCFQLGLAMPPLSPSILLLVDALPSLRHLIFMLQSNTLPGFTTYTARKLQKWVVKLRISCLLLSAACPTFSLLYVCFTLTGSQTVTR